MFLQFTCHHNYYSCDKAVHVTVTRLCERFSVYTGTI